jgi:hypothetical protein
MWQVLDMNPGVHRRQMIVALLESGKDVLCVNCKYRPQVNQDSDLKYLIRKKVLKIIRENRGGLRSRRTYLVLNKELQ